MEKPEVDFSLDDLLAQLQPEEVPDGVTTREVCKRCGWPATKGNMARVYNRINDLIELDLWEYAGKKEVSSVIGAKIFSPAYRPKRGGGAE